jgi:hypothetical protein
MTTLKTIDLINSMDHELCKGHFSPSPVAQKNAARKIKNPPL